MSPENTTLPAELEARLGFETLLPDLSSKFVNLPAGEADREIIEAERRIWEVSNLRSPGSVAVITCTSP